MRGQRAADRDEGGSTTGDRRLTALIALAANMVIAAAKVVGGVVSGSQALIAEAAHSIADSGNEASLLVSLRLARRPPDADHPFGYGKERFFWASVAAMFIFLAGGAFAVQQGISALLGGERHIDSLGVSYGVLGVAFVAEGASFTRALGEMRRRYGGQLTEVVRNFRRDTEPVNKTIVLEDGAALVGLSLATGGLVLFQVTGQVFWDSVASIAIGVLLTGVAVVLGLDMRDLLLGRAADPAVRRRLERVLAYHTAVDAVVEVLTMHLGPDSLLVAARIDLTDDVTGDEIERASDQIEAELRAAVPAVTEVFLDATPAGRSSRPGVSAGRSNSGDERAADSGPEAGPSVT